MKKSLKRLVIDSATKYLYIALYDGENNVGEFYEAGHNDHSVKLMTEIEVLFKNNDTLVEDLDEIIIGIGPGSYTGLRIGVVVAKMFGWNNNIPVKTISSLALIASSSDSDKLLLAEIDARRGNSFLGVYRNTGKGLELVQKEELTNLEEYKSNIINVYEVVSSGKPNINKILASDLLKDVKDIHGLNPNYLRLTEAERNLGK
jgi:tRNA threonylcarbamoyladenosine biosynthesis protein TsaB